MIIKVILEANEIDTPIRFATAIIEKCMNVTTFDSNEIDMNYHYLKEVNEHIDVFLKNFDYKGSDSEYQSFTRQKVRDKE